MGLLDTARGIRRKLSWHLRDRAENTFPCLAPSRSLIYKSYDTPADLIQTPYFDRAILNCLPHRRFWADPHWIRTLDEIDPGNIQMHRKAFEYAQTAVGLQTLGVLDPHGTVLAVGAGHDLLLYWLANRVQRVIATDRYDLHDARWSSSESDAAMLADPARFARTEYRRNALEVYSMDARELRLEDASVDIVYSLSSIEHFGLPSDIRQAMSEIHRVVKPGGVVALATELALNRISKPEVFSWSAFERDVLRSTPLKLIQPISFDISSDDIADPVRADRGETRVPHLVLRDRSTLFTSIMVFFQKGLELLG